MFLCMFLKVFCKFFFKKTSDSLAPSFLVSDVCESIRSLMTKERTEQIAQVAHKKWANERIANFLSKSLFR